MPQIQAKIYQRSFEIVKDSTFELFLANPPHIRSSDSDQTFFGYFFWRSGESGNKQIKYSSFEKNLLLCVSYFCEIYKKNIENAVKLVN